MFAAETEQLLDQHAAKNCTQPIPLNR
jgi:hypothetical protein